MILYAKIQSIITEFMIGYVLQQKVFINSLGHEKEKNKNCLVGFFKKQIMLALIPNIRQCFDDYYCCTVPIIT